MLTNGLIENVGADTGDSKYRGLQQNCFFGTSEAPKTSHALMIQFDGYVLSGDRFSDNFLSYDYIGAPWPHYQSHKVGNGGFRCDQEL